MLLSKVFDSFYIKLEQETKWPFEGASPYVSEWSKHWVLYEDSRPIAAIADDNLDSQDNVIIRHIEVFHKGRGYGEKIILKLLESGKTVITGKPDYNSIHPNARSLFNKIHQKADEIGIKSEIIGNANNRGKDYPEEEDYFHYRWQKK